MISLDYKHSIAMRIAMLVFLVVAGFGTIIASIGIYMSRDLLTTIINGELVQKSAVISKTLEIELERARSDAEDMARSPLIMNALADTEERQAYLLPYIANFRTRDAAAFRISVHDFNGAELAANGLRIGEKNTEMQWRDLAHGGWQPALGGAFGGRVQLIFPVIYTATQTVEGFVVWDIDLGDMLRQAASFVRKDATVSLRAGGLLVTRFGQRIQPDDLEHKRSLAFAPSIDGLDLTLYVHHRRALIGVPMGQLTIISICGGIVALILALVIARLIGRRIAAPIVQLSQVAANVDPKRLGDRLELPGGTDEVATLGRAFEEMVDRLRQSHEKLERRVLERTFELEVAEERSRDQASQLHSIVNNIADGIVTIDADGTIEAVNTAAEKIFGYAADKMVGHNVKMLMPEAYSSAHDGYLRHHRVTGEVGIMGRPRELVGQRSDGTVFPLELAVSQIRESERILYTGVVRDITEMKQARDELRLAASVFEATVEAIAITDCDGKILAVNGAFEELTGHSPRTIVGSRLCELWAIDPDNQKFQEFRDELMKTGRWQGEFAGIRTDGLSFVTWQSASLVRDSDGEPARLVVVFADITELRNKDQHIRHQAFHDSLTNLPNRALLRDRLDQSINSARRSGKQIAVMFLDLDRFKLINDSLGHNAGDQLLKKVADRLRSCLRRKDTISRLGGDEFVVLIDDFDSTDFLGKVAAKIIDAVVQPVNIDGHDLQVSTSIGIAVYPDNGTDVERLMRNADVAMYQAKEAGRNCFKLYHLDMNSRSVERLDMETALRRALEREEFELYYQPKVDLVSGRPCGLEALIRWRHPTRGLVSPLDFIPIAEETGLILPIGEWVIQRACKQIKEWEAEGAPVLPVAINLSARQFRDVRVVAKINEALARSGLGASMLELEVTESTIMSREGDTMEVMAELRQLGHSLMVDDFGTGYSSLSYLRQLAISGLKIDRSFIDGIGVNPEDEAIVEAVLGIAEALDLETVAEGIETVEQADFLIAKGCRIGQGYLYAKPLPQDECARWVGEMSKMSSDTNNTLVEFKRAESF